MEVRIVVAGHAYNGPDFFFLKINCPPLEVINGNHYEFAKEKARENGYDEPMVVFDQFDPPKSLFDLFQWDFALIYSLPESQT